MTIKQPTIGNARPTAQHGSAGDTDQPSPFVIWLAAIGSGILVATIYYAQPLIDPISRDIGMSRQAAGLIVTAMQAGYGLGLAFIAPLVDRYENRMLVTLSLMVTALALASLAFAQNELTFLLPATIAGIACVGAQILLPMIAGMASVERRGRVIGTIMAGLLGGIMLARPVSSFIASFIGWRGVFLAASAATFAVGILLRAFLPERRPTSSQNYLATLRSILSAVGRYSVLRRRMGYQMIMFGLFTAFWTTVPLMLVDHFGFDQRKIALFALAGAGGALAAPVAGRIADRGYSRAATMIVSLVAAVILPLTQTFIALGWLAALTIGTVLFDACVQTNQIIGQRMIYALSDTERGRINSAYMTSIFIAGAFTSALGPVLYEQFGWSALAYCGGALAVLIAINELRSTAQN